MEQTSKTGKAMDGALDHISLQRVNLDRARLALFEIREAAAPFVAAGGPSGLLAEKVIAIIDSSAVTQ